ncbi:MAG: hypothetical protein WC966_03230 [Bradymonadales bacterium]
MKQLAVICVVFCLLSLYAQKLLAYDEFDEAYAPNNVSLHFQDLSFQIKGRMRLGLHDLEGSGGPGYDSPTDTQTIGTRSPFVELDSFDLAFRLQWMRMLALNSSVEFLTSGARLSNIYFAYSANLHDKLHHKAELGYLQPIFATHRYTARYPLIASVNWKNAEYHAAYKLKYQINNENAISLALAASMQRPLKSEPLHSSPTYKGSFSILAYGNARAFSGNSVAATALLRFESHGLALEGFGFIGKLSTHQGLDILIADFPHYRLSPKHNPDAKSGLAYLAGGRIYFEKHGFHFLAEAIFNRTGQLKHFGYYAQAGLELSRKSTWFHSMMFLLRYEQLLLLDSSRPLNSSYAMRSPEQSNAISWDYSIATLAIHAKILREFLTIRLEYAMIFERNDVPALAQRNLDVDNNELLVQLEAIF